MRFDDRVTGNVNKYARQAKVIHIDIDQSEINKIIAADVGIHADAKQALEALLPLVHQAKHDEWMCAFKDADSQEHEKVIQFEFYPVTKDLRMGEVVRELSEQTKGEAIIVTDVGQHQMVTSRYYPFRNPRTNVTSGGAGTMGFALPAAVGAKVAKPGSTVVAVIGDGGFQMTLQELGTIMQMNLPVKILIMNNNFLGMVRQWQQLFFESRYSFTEMKNPNFILLAEAYKIPSRQITHRSELKAGIEAMLKSEGPFLLEAVVEKEENVFPMVPTGAGVGEIILEAKKKE
jgi:acetolactate synthase-1/2/3 large subunit